ncbi:MAG: hypothetical protein AAGJ73_06915 [Pseudomonadota bacterium]
MPFKFLLVGLIAFFSSVPAHASAVGGTLALYEAGRYDDVVTRAETEANAASFVLAARALNAVAYFADDRKEARRAAARALEFSEAAIEAAPDDPEGHLQAAISMAVRGANMAPARAFFLGLARRSRRHIDDALALNPDNAWALSTSAAWRLEVARRGGGRLYGADPDEGFREFVRARQNDPDNIVIAYECALRLLASENVVWRQDALEALEVALNVAPATAFEADIQARAKALQSAMTKGRKAELAFIAAQP